jgi:hypothetical protein
MAQSGLRPPSTRSTSHQNDLEGAKRRSLLPQPGQTRQNLRLISNATAKQDTPIQETTSGRTRPKSAYQGLDQAASKSIRPQASVTKPQAPQLDGLARSRSLRKPSVPSQPAQSTGGFHSRTQSTNNASLLRREAIETSTVKERPRSLLSVPSIILKPRNAPANAASIAPKSSSKLAAPSRTVSVQSKPEGSIGVSTRSATRPEKPVESLPHRGESLKEDTATRTAKPAFTTLQRHFTPRKAGKAPTSTFLHPAPVSGSNSLPPEVVSLQSELLQLHLLHEASARVEQLWQISAERTLHERFDEVASLHQAMLEFERMGLEQKNIQALLEWSAGAPSTGLVEYIQVLSGPLYELPSLVEPGGRFQRLVGDFERWMQWVEETRSDRVESSEHGGDLGSVEGLGDSWKAETATLIRKVTSFIRDLGHLQRPLAGSSIACIVDTCSALLAGLLEGLHIMQSIEAEVVLKEKEWVEDRLQAIARDVGSHFVPVTGEDAAWRM